MEKFLNALRVAYSEHTYNSGLSVSFLRSILIDALDPPPGYGEYSGLSSVQSMWFWGIVLVIDSLFVSVVLQNGLQLMRLVAMRTRTVIGTALFQKSLRLSNKGKGAYPPGKVLNLASLDAGKVEWALTMLPYSVSSVVSFCLVISFLVLELEYAAPVGFAVMIPLIPVIFVLILILLKLWGLISKAADERVKAVTELLQTIRVVKFFGWEEAMVKRIDAFRKKQSDRSICNRAVFSILVIFIRSSTVIMSVAMFITLYFIEGRLDPLKVFVALAYLNILRGPMTMMPVAVAGMLEMRVALGRLAAFLGGEEIVPVDDLVGKDVSCGIVVHAMNASFKWDSVKKDPSKKNGDKKKGQPSATSETTPNHDKDSSSSNMEKGTRVDLAETQTEDEPDAEVGKSGCICACICAPKPNPTEAGEDEDKFGRLKNVNLEIHEGELVFIFGKIGSGKSSLVHALLGEMRKTDGVLRVTKDVAFCEQTPWIMNDTVQNNIVFFSDAVVDEAKLNEVIRVCELEPDLAVLQGGRNAEIGERGINLSGGQKWRCSLARACYSDASVYLLDDPLGAVDANVGRRLLMNCICGYLKDKTRIVVTHDLGILSHADRIVLMDDGEIIEQGGYEELMAQKGAAYDLVSQFVLESEEEDEEEGEESSEKNAATENQEENKESLMEDEESALGRISCDVICSYLKACGGPGPILMLVLIFLGCQMLLASISWFLAEWSNQTFNDRYGNEYLATFGYNVSTNENGTKISSGYVPYENNNGSSCPFPAPASCGNLSVAIVWIEGWNNNSLVHEGTLSQEACVGIYASVSLLFLLFLFLKMFCSAAVGVHAANVYHHDALVRVTKAPMSFFDTTPVGRMISRFSGDIGRVSSEAPSALQGLFSVCLNVAFSLAVIAYTTYGISIMLVFVIIPFYFIVYLLYRRFAVQVKRIASVARSPAMAFFSESLHGLTTIKAFLLDITFSKKFSKLQNLGNRVSYLQQSANRWLSVILGFGGSFIIAFVCALCIYLGFFAPDAIQLDVSYLALAITKSLMLTFYFSGVVESLTSAEVAFNSVERMYYYCTQLPLEEDIGEEKLVVPSDEWPPDGKVELCGFSMRYREGLPEVLKEVSFAILARERLGIVGRTGSGKSSLFLSLVRFVEASRGSIKIDGIDIAKIPLRSLRQSLAIVPQDPVLFSGTIRSNLDPFGQYSDDLLWQALERTFLKEKISEMPEKLESEAQQGGKNFSVGERQLICLCRALLKKCRILLLDECTASVDMPTDVKIQRTIRECFVDCTVLTIAHRLHTIVDSHRILVMDDGKRVELDSPRNLLRLKKYHFFKELVEETGRANAKYLKAVALGELEFDLQKAIEKAQEKKESDEDEDEDEAKKIQRVTEGMKDDEKEVLLDADVEEEEEGEWDWVEVEEVADWD